MKFIKWLLLTILVWFVLYCWEYSNNSSFFTFPWIQFLLCWISLISSMVEVPYEEHRILLIRLFKVEISTLEGGVYFIPFLWLWGEVFIPKEFREDKKEHHLHIDTRETRRHREIGLVEDISREHFFPFIFGKGLWAFVLTCAISYGLNVKLIPYLKNQTPVVNYVAGFMGHKTQINNQENINSQVATQSEQNQSQYQQASPVQEEKTYYGKDTASSPTDSFKKSVADISNSENQNIVLPSSTEVLVQPGWFPPANSFNPGVTWNNLKSKDNWSIVSDMKIGMNYVNVSGYFVSSYHSTYHYYPNIYVDGFNGDQKFFCHFFKVLVREMTFKNGQTWSNQIIDLCDYIEMIEEEQRIDKECYRDIKIYLKDEFKDKYSWHLVDAGWGDSRGRRAIAGRRSL